MALTYYNNYIVNSLGQPIVNVNIAVLNSPSNTATQPGTVLSNIYYDAVGLFPMSNPISPATPVPSYQVFYGNNSIITGTEVVTTVPFTVPNVGPFSVSINLGAIPQAAIIENTANANISLQYSTPFDQNNVYLVSDTANVSSNLIIFTELIQNLPTAPTFNTGLDNLGNFSFYVANGTYDIQYYGGSLSEQLIESDIIIGPPVINYGPTNLSGIVDGVNTIFTLGATPASPLEIIISLGGVIMKQGLDYTLSGTTITFITPPFINTIIQSFFTI